MLANQEIKIVDFNHIKYGDYPSLNSAFKSNRKWISIKQLDQTKNNQDILVRGRIHVLRSKGNCCFLILRQNYFTLQAIIIKNQEIPKEMIRYLSRVPQQSIIDLIGKVVICQKPIENCTQKNVQLQIQKFFIVNRSVDRLPLPIRDANKKVIKYQLFENDSIKQQQPPVRMKTRLDNRVLDLRSTAKQAIFRLQSGICQIFRQFLIQKNFIQVHTPKIFHKQMQINKVQGRSFKLDCFAQQAQLIQSTYFYKQMYINGDFQKVFEIGPVFRQENGCHAHLCQFVCLDVEMAIKQDYFQLMDFLSEVFFFLFKQIEKRFERQLKAINEQFQFEKIKFTTPIIKLAYEQALALLQSSQLQGLSYNYLSREGQKRIGNLIKEKYKTDFYVIHRYPAIEKQFNIMPCEDNTQFSCSFTFFMRGQSVFSGGQRIHDFRSLKQSIKKKDIKIQQAQLYLSNFIQGNYPHGGGSLGLQRFTMLYCDLKNIRNCSLFPRDQHRLNP